MKLPSITFVTGNESKVREVSRILDIPLEIKEVELDEIQELDLEKVALNKLNQAYEIVKKPVIIDDVSVEIDEWNCFPGPLVKWMLKGGEGEAGLVLKMLGSEKNRKATAKLAIGFHDGKIPYIFIGEAKGRIATEIMGENGFGWDPVFIPEGFDISYAQMDPKEKDKISHRGKALAKFKDFLNKNYEL
jgi:XTP/dITP diphosphohydrolase